MEFIPANLGEIGQNPSHPQKFACSLHLCVAPPHI